MKGTPTRYKIPERAAKELVAYFEGVRGTGSTTAMAAGAANIVETSGERTPLVVCITKSWAEGYRKVYGLDACVLYSIQQVANLALQGQHKRPLVLDHSALVSLLSGLLHNIHVLDLEINKLKEN